MSMTGALIGNPLPRLKRCTRAASIEGAMSVRPSCTRQAFAVVPPMSNENYLRLVGRAADQRGCEPAACRPRLQQADRETPRHLGRGQAARRLHQPEPAGKAAMA